MVSRKLLTTEQLEELRLWAIAEADQRDAKFHAVAVGTGLGELIDAAHEKGVNSGFIAGMTETLAKIQSMLSNDHE